MAEKRRKLPLLIAALVAGAALLYIIVKLDVWFAERNAALPPAPPAPEAPAAPDDGTTVYPPTVDPDAGSDARPVGPNTPASRDVDPPGNDETSR